MSRKGARVEFFGGLPKSNPYANLNTIRATGCKRRQPCGNLRLSEGGQDLDAPIIIETSLWQLEGISFRAGDPHRGLAIYYAHINLLANSKEFEQIPV